jgi:nucleotide-binding universal stress UspA family protein
MLKRGAATNFTAMESTKADQTTMNTESTPKPGWKPSSVLIAIDDLDTADEVVDAGLELASAERAKVTVLQIVSEADWRVRRLGPAAMAAPQRLQVGPEDVELHAAARKAKARNVEATLMIVSGDPADQIVEVADEIGADLVVVGAHQRTTLADLLFGDTSAHVIKHARQPVLVIRKAAEDAVEES